MLSKHIQIFFHFTIIFATFQAHLIQPTKVKRGIFGTVTSTISKTIEEKHYVPATCVHFESNLPDCRNVRFLNFPAFNGIGYFQQTDDGQFINNNNNNDNRARELTSKSEGNIIKFQQRQLDQTVHVQGWAEYLGLTQPTVTVTEIKIVPTTVLDPRIVVTYAIKGCKPENLPTHLKQCPEENTVNLVEILPTSPAAAAAAGHLNKVETTKTPENFSLDVEKLLEGTEIEQTTGTVEGGEEHETTTLVNSSVATPQL